MKPCQECKGNKFVDVRLPDRSGKHDGLVEHVIPCPTCLGKGYTTQDDTRRLAGRCDDPSCEHCNQGNTMIHRVYIYLANAEWGNEIMRKVSDEYAAQSDKRPLYVTISEHGGWHLSYLYGAPGIEDGTICGTANDTAALDPAVVEYGKTIDKVEILPEIRR